MEKDAKIPILEAARIYADLRKQVTKKGILERSYGYYFLLSLMTLFGFFASLYLIFTINSPLSLIAMSAVLTAFSVQIGGLLHDAGHKAIFKSSTNNDILGNICGSLMVMGYGRWKFDHNKHHSNPNEEDEDPDLELPLHGFTSSRFLKEKGIAGMIKRYQMFTFYPVRAFFVFTRRLEAFKDCFEGPNQVKTLKLAAFSAGIIFWFIAPFYFFNLGKAILLVLSVNIFSGLYFPNIFAPNHKGMPQFKKGTKVSFLEQQIVTARNIKPSWWKDILYAGLNYQIEHHLFPNCPRNKLKQITPYVKKVCQQTGLKYTEAGIIESNKIILAHLNKVALSS